MVQHFRTFSKLFTQCISFSMGTPVKEVFRNHYYHFNDLKSETQNL